MQTTYRPKCLTICVLTAVTYSCLGPLVLVRVTLRCLLVDGAIGEEV